MTSRVVGSLVAYEVVCPPSFLHVQYPVLYQCNVPSPVVFSPAYVTVVTETRHSRSGLRFSSHVAFNVLQSLQADITFKKKPMLQT